MVDQPLNETQPPPDVNEIIREKGAEFMLGMDVDRLWVTGVQAFILPTTSILVFREQNIVPREGGGWDQALKNVTSVVIPTPVIKELYNILGLQLAALDEIPSE